MCHKQQPEAEGSLAGAVDKMVTECLCECLGTNIRDMPQPQPHSIRVFVCVFVVERCLSSGSVVQQLTAEQELELELEACATATGKEVNATRCLANSNLSAGKMAETLVSSADSCRHIFQATETFAHSNLKYVSAQCLTSERNVCMKWRSLLLVLEM